MDLADVKDVVVNSRDGYKYVLIEVADENGDKKLVIRANETVRWHEDIVKLFQRECKLSARCLGGGRIWIDAAQKKIRLWDYSGDYGREDRSKTVEVLKTAFPDFEITTD